MKEHSNILSCLILMIGIQLSALGQDVQVDRNFNTWWSNTNKFHLSSKVFLSSELHVRRTQGLKKWQQFLLRPAVNCKINDRVVTSMGYTFIQTYPYGSHPIKVTSPEHNLWEQVMLKHRVLKADLSHRFRAEFRLIGQKARDNGSKHYTTTFEYAQRVRYRFAGSIPLGGNQKFFGKWFDEIMLTLSDSFKPTPLSLNQNWLYLGFMYKFSETGNMQFGLMDQFIEKGDGIHYERNPTIQCAIGFEIGKSKAKR